MDAKIVAFLLESKLGIEASEINEESAHDFIVSIGTFAKFCGYKIEEELDFPMDIMKEIKQHRVDNSLTGKEDEEGEIRSRKRPRKLPEFEMQIKDTTASEMKDKIGKIIQENRERIDQSNKTEFLAERSGGAARTSEPNPELDRKSQISLGIVENKYGPLNRTNSRNNNDNNNTNEDEDSKLISNAISNGSNASSGLEQRIKDIEEHVNGTCAINTKDLFLRVKSIEDFLIIIEEEAPALAKRFFKAHSNHNTPSNPANKQYKLNVNVNDDPLETISGNGTGDSVRVLRAADGSEEADENDSEEEELKDEELNRRISELKKKLC